MRAAMEGAGAEGDLASALEAPGASGNNSAAAAGAGDSAPSAGAASNGQQSTSLNRVLTVDLVSPVLADPGLRAQLFPHHPPGHDQTEQEIRDLIASPQFQQAVSELDSALRQGQLDPVLWELGLQLDDSNPDRVMALLQAIRQKKNSARNEGMDESQ